MTEPTTNLTVQEQSAPIAKPVSGFDAILQSNGVVPNREFRVCGYELSTQEGMRIRARHTGSQIPDGTKDTWLNKPFDLVRATSWPVAAFTTPDGERLKEPKLLIRTVMETKEGDLIPSSSSWVYQSLQEIIESNGGVSPEKPIRMRLGKAGSADKLFDCQFDKK